MLIDKIDYADPPVWGYSVAIRPDTFDLMMEQEFWLFNIRHKILHRSVSGEGHDIILHTVPAGLYLPWHMQNDAEKLLYTLDGGYSIDLGDGFIYQQKGSSIKLPRGVPCAMNFNKTVCQVLSVTYPGGFAEMLRLAGDPDMLNDKRKSGNIALFIEKFQAANNVILPSCHQPYLSKKKY